MKLLIETTLYCYIGYILIYTLNTDTFSHISIRVRHKWKISRIFLYIFQYLIVFHWEIKKGRAWNGSLFYIFCDRFKKENNREKCSMSAQNNWIFNKSVNVNRHYAFKTAYDVITRNWFEFRVWINNQVNFCVF